MAYILFSAAILLLDISCGYYFGFYWWWIAATVFAACSFIYNVRNYHQDKKHKVSKYNLEKIRSEIMYHCFEKMGWDSVGSAIICDNAIEVWGFTPDGKKSKSCIYVIDGDNSVRCFLNINNFKEFAE